MRIHHLVLAGMPAIAPNVAYACPNCVTSEEVWTAVQRQGWATLAIMIFAFAIVGALIFGTTRFVSRGRLLLGGAMLAGAGLGALFDGILLHQILQWHQMLSSVVFPGDLVTSKLNMFWDGLFHAFAWITTATAVVLLVPGVRHAPARLLNRFLLGGAAAGWGLFNLVEGLIDHQLLGLHHVHPGVHELEWDVAFLFFGALLVLAGAAAIAGEAPVRRLHRASAR